MKEHFKSVDKQNCMKLERSPMRDYFKLLHTEMGNQFQHAASISEECFEDVWHEMDFNETGCITWHQVKPFIARAAIHEDELAEERRLAEEERIRQE